MQQNLSGSHGPRNNTIERVVVGGKRRSCVLSDKAFAAARSYGRLGGGRKLHKQKFDFSKNFCYNIYVKKIKKKNFYIMRSGEVVISSPS